MKKEGEIKRKEQKKPRSNFFVSSSSHFYFQLELEKKIQQTNQPSDISKGNFLLSFQDFKLIKQIGEGSYGTVWKSIWNGMGEVKKLHRKN